MLDFVAIIQLDYRSNKAALLLKVAEFELDHPSDDKLD